MSNDNARDTSKRANHSNRPKRQNGPDGKCVKTLTTQWSNMIKFIYLPALIHHYFLTF